MQTPLAGPPVPWGRSRIDHAARLIETTAVADRSAMVFDLLGASGVVLDLDPVGRVRVLELMDDGIDRTILARAASCPSYLAQQRGRWQVSCRGLALDWHCQARQQTAIAI